MKSLEKKVTLSFSAVMTNGTLTTSSAVTSTRKPELNRKPT